MKVFVVPLFALSLFVLAAALSNGHVGASPLESAPASDAARVSLTLSLMRQGDTIIVYANGTPPYHGTIYGKCATLVRSATVSSFTLTFASYGLLCILAVQDASGQVRAIGLGDAPPRTFLHARPSIRPDATGTVHVEQRSSLVANVDEPLEGAHYNTPYSAEAVGACATVTPQTISSAGPFSITASAPGRCVVVFGDSAGQATALNLAVP